RVEAVGVLAREDAETELVARERDRRLGEVEAELLKRATARRDEDVARRRERRDRPVGRRPAWRLRDAREHRSRAGRADVLQPVASREIGHGVRSAVEALI